MIKDYLMIFFLHQYHYFHGIHYSLVFMIFFILLIYHKKIWDSLFVSHHSLTLNKIYEWEPYLGRNDKAVIIHWHGVKPHVNCNSDFAKIAFDDQHSLFNYLLRNETEIQYENHHKQSRYHYLMQFKTSYSGYKHYMKSYMHYFNKICNTKITATVKKNESRVSKMHSSNNKYHNTTNHSLITNNHHNVSKIKIS